MALIRSAGLCVAVCLLAMVGVLSRLRQKTSTVEWIAYTQSRPYSSTVDLYLMDNRAFMINRIATDVQGEGLWWSPDGKKLAFLRERPVFGVCIIFINSWHESCPSTRVTGYIWSQQPSWSPDGKWLTVMQISETKQVLGRIHPRWGDFYPLLQNDELTGASVWSPDGKKIFFLTYNETSNNLRLQSVDTKDFKLNTIANKIRTMGFLLSLSPDGQWFAVGQAYPLIIGIDGMQIQDSISLMNWFGWTSDNQLLATNDSETELYLIDPAIPFPRTIVSDISIYIMTAISSFDGQYILFSAGNKSGYGYGLYQIHRDGTGLKQIKVLQEPIFDLAWSPPIDLPWNQDRLIGGAVGLFLLLLMLVLGRRRTTWR